MQFQPGNKFILCKCDVISDASQVGQGDSIKTPCCCYALVSDSEHAPVHARQRSTLFQEPPRLRTPG